MPFLRLVPALLLAATFLVLATAQRLLLLWLLSPRVKPSLGDAFEALARGARVDLACTGLVLAPLALWCSILPERAWASRLHRLSAGAAFVAGITGIITFLTVDALQFWVHAARLDHPLRERLIVAWRMIAGAQSPWQLTAVVALGCLVASVLVALALRGAFRRAWKEVAAPLLRGRDFVLVLAACVLGVALMPRTPSFPAAPILDEIADSSIPPVARAVLQRVQDH